MIDIKKEHEFIVETSTGDSYDFFVRREMDLFVSAIQEIQELVIKSTNDVNKYPPKNKHLTIAEIILELNERLNDYRDHVADLERLKSPMQNDSKTLVAQMELAIEDDKQEIKGFVRECLAQREI